MTTEEYQQARATILKSIFIDKMGYDEVSSLIHTKYGLDYEEVAYRMDCEGCLE